MRARKPTRRPWNLSFVSMSDLAFLLIIFFAVAGKFTKESERQVLLPAVDLGERSQPREIRLTIDKLGQYFVNDSRVEKDALRDEIQYYLVPDSPREQRTVRLFADKDADYGAVFNAIEACNQADVYLEVAVQYSR